MDSPKLETELRLIERALRPEQFRLIVVQYNHTLAISQLRDHLSAVYPGRTVLNLDARTDGTEGVLSAFKDPVNGIVFVHHIEELLADTAFTQSFNQRRDALSRYEMGLVLLMPAGGDYLQKFSRVMPDLWSLRNLVAEIKLSNPNTSSGQFITNDGRAYHSFQDQAEIQAEIAALQQRIQELIPLPSSKQLLSTLYLRLGKLQMQLSNYGAAKAALESAKEIAVETVNKQDEATALTELGEVLLYLADYDSALPLLEQSLEIQREIKDKHGEGGTLNNLSQIYSAQKDYQTAFSYLMQSLAIQREIGDKSGEGTTLNNISQIYEALGDYETALSYLEQSLENKREIGNKYAEGTALNNISQIYDERGDYQTAHVYLEQALAIQREVGDKHGEGITLNNISHIFNAWGNHQTALSYLEQALAIAYGIGDINGTAITLINMGILVWEKLGKIEKAIPMFMEAYSIFSQIGSPNKEVAESYLNGILQEIGEERFREIAGDDFPTTPPSDTDPASSQ